METVVGVVSPGEAEYFAEFADELYFGVPHIENHRKWHSGQHLAAKADVKLAIRAAHSRGRKIILAANEIYAPSVYAKVLDGIRRLLDLGVNGLIVRDFFLLDHFADRTPGISLILSSTAGCFNSESARFYSNFRPDRIVIPQHVLPTEFAPVLKRMPGPRYEIFYFPDSFCPNIDGVCPFHDINKTGNPRNCSASHSLGGIPYRMPKPSGLARLGMIYDYYRLGVRHIKMPRDGTFEEKKASLRRIRRLSVLLRGGTSREEFLRRASGQG